MYGYIYIHIHVKKCMCTNMYIAGQPLNSNIYIYSYTYKYTQRYKEYYLEPPVFTRLMMPFLSPVTAEMEQELPHSVSTSSYCTLVKGVGTTAEATPCRWSFTT